MTLNTRKIRAFMKKKGISQQALAKQLNCSSRTVTYLLAGDMETKAETIFNLARLMNCRVETLIINFKQGTARKRLEIKE